MAFRDVKKELTEMDKTEIVKLISEMYNKIPAAKTFLDVFVTGDFNQIKEKYKKEIERYIYPNGPDMQLRDTEARKIIRTVQKMKITELNVELELHYVLCCLEVIESFGYWDDAYYLALEKIFYNATSGIEKLSLHEKYEERIIGIIEKANRYGLELSY